MLTTQTKVKIRIKDLMRLYLAAVKAADPANGVGIYDAERSDKQFIDALNQFIEMDLHDLECGLYCVSMLQEAGKLRDGEAAASMAHRLVPNLKFNKTLHVFEEKI